MGDAAQKEKNVRNKDTKIPPRTRYVAVGHGAIDHQTKPQGTQKRQTRITPLTYWLAGRPAGWLSFPRSPWPGNRHPRLRGATPPSNHSAPRPAKPTSTRQGQQQQYRRVRLGRAYPHARHARKHRRPQAAPTAEVSANTAGGSIPEASPPSTPAATTTTRSNNSSCSSTDQRSSPMPYRTGLDKADPIRRETTTTRKQKSRPRPTLRRAREGRPAGTNPTGRQQARCLSSSSTSSCPCPSSCPPSSSWRRRHPAFPCAGRWRTSRARPWMPVPRGRHRSPPRSSRRPSFWSCPRCWKGGQA